MTNGGDNSDEAIVVRRTCRAYQALCRRYPFTTEERVVLEHLWVLVQDQWLDAELGDLENDRNREVCGDAGGTRH